MTRLHIPRALPVALLLLGGVMAASTVRGVLRATRAVGGPAPALAATGSLVWAAIAGGLALLLLVTALRWLSFNVAIDAEGIAVRLGRRRWSIPIADVKGVVLQQSGTTPQLRIVRRAGAVLVLPGWSLRATHEDGEVEDAADALPALGLSLGFGVRVRTLTRPPADVAPPGGRS